MNSVKCPICEDRIEVGIKVKLLERLSCPTCEALLEVVSVDPLEVDWIYYDEYYESNGRERSKTPKSAQCPLCRETIFLGLKIKMGEKVTCPGCEARLEIVSLYPIELDWSYNDGSDYYYRDDDLFEEEFGDLEG
jgi:uncharacterized paraquat-inducible protein A